MLEPIELMQAVRHCHAVGGHRIMHITPLKEAQLSCLADIKTPCLVGGHMGGIYDQGVTCHSFVLAAIGASEDPSLAGGHEAGFATSLPSGWWPGITFEARSDHHSDSYHHGGTHGHCSKEEIAKWCLV